MGVLATNEGNAPRQNLQVPLLKEPYPIPSRFIATLGSADPVFSSTHLATATHSAVPASSTARLIHWTWPGIALCATPPSHQKTTPTPVPLTTAAIRHRPISA